MAKVKAEVSEGTAIISLKEYERLKATDDRRAAAEEELEQYKKDNTYWIIRDGFSPRIEGPKDVNIKELINQELMECVKDLSNHRAEQRELAGAAREAYHALRNSWGNAFVPTKRRAEKALKILKEACDGSN